MTTVLEKLEEELSQQIDNGNRGRTHIVNPPMNLHIWITYEMSGQDIVDTARSLGWPIKMLCGLVFVPKNDTEKYPACEECIRIAGELMAEEGE